MTPGPRTRWTIYRMVAAGLFLAVCFTPHKLAATIAFFCFSLLLLLFERVDSKGRESRFGVPVDRDDSKFDE